MKELPEIMLAPNGARLTKADHPAIPITIEEIIDTAKKCFAAGARALHAHVRNYKQQHVLDAGLYNELIAEMTNRVPEMSVQITTESVGQYTPEQQRKLVRNVKPKAVSVSLTEMLSDNDIKSAKSFYYWCHENNIAIQHILYSSQELEKYIFLNESGFLPNGIHQLLFVLGRYTSKQQSEPQWLDEFVKILNRSKSQADWAVCAFGRNETLCAVHAIKKGGKCRVGFENSIYNANGDIAKDNTERILDVINHIL